MFSLFLLSCCSFFIFLFLSCKFLLDKALTLFFSQLCLLCCLGRFLFSRIVRFLILFLFFLWLSCDFGCLSSIWLSLLFGCLSSLFLLNWFLRNFWLIFLLIICFRSCCSLSTFLIVDCFGRLVFGLFFLFLTLCDSFLNSFHNSCFHNIFISWLHLDFSFFFLRRLILDKILL